MRDLLSILRRFRRDEGGAFLALFAVMAIALVATSGAVIDFVRVDSARAKAQVALDAATLALQPSIYTKTTAQIQQEANLLVNERLGDDSITAVIDAIDVDTTDGTLFLRAALKVPMAFVGLVGINELETNIISQATRKRLYIEVAFVLDNSGSMSGSRMTNLKSAATCATKILFYGSCNPASGTPKLENVKAAVVPFTTFVNVGAGNANASWMDTAGNSSIANDNFDNDDNDATPFNGPVNRFALYDQLSNVSWAGCVEARRYPYSTDDTAPNPGLPDTLFVPVFAPDEPDNTNGFNNSYLPDNPSACNPPASTVTGHCSCVKWNGFLLAGGQTCTFTPNNGSAATTSPDACSCSVPWQSQGFNFFYGQTYGYSCTANATGGGGGGDNAAGLSNRERQERLCKYTGAISASGTRGPNSDCLSTPILPLTDNPDAVLSRINSMTANGYTNIQQGAVWGFHVLTPSQPFAEGRSYDTAVSKVMVLMTDGENTFVSSNNMNGSGFLQAYGHIYNAPTSSTNGRLGKSVANGGNMPGVMNTLTEETCTNAKAADIQVFTIGLNPPNNATRTMLTNCASTPANAYFPSDPAELNGVFTSIAEQLSQLRIAR